MNVSAGIGVIGFASPMLQEVFGGSLIGVTQKFGDLDETQFAEIATVAAGITALLSLRNIGGRFFWASLSDKVGRKMTCIVFFVLGGLLPATAWPEKTGTVSNTDRMVQMGKQAVTPPGQAKPDLWIIQQLAGRLGLTWSTPANTMAWLRSTKKCVKLCMHLSAESPGNVWSVSPA